VLCAVAMGGRFGLWLDVPYIHQEKDGCGAASLAMVLRYWHTARMFRSRKGAPIPARIQARCYMPQSRVESYAVDMERLFA